MILHITQKEDGNFMAGCGDKEMHHILKDELSKVWTAASPLLTDSEESIEFKFDEISVSCKEYSANWSHDLCGYSIIFNDGSTAQTETCRLVCKSDVYVFIRPKTNYDNPSLSEKQKDLIDDFVRQINTIKSYFG